MKKINLIGLILFLGVLIFILNSHRIESFITDKVIDLLANAGIETQAEILSKEPASGILEDEKGKTSYVRKLKTDDAVFGEIYYQYRDQKGNIRQGFEKLNRSEFEMYDPGNDVTILYFKNFPAFSRLKSKVEAHHSRSTA